MKYTIGEITRKGLLKNRKGEPYTDKARVSQILQKYPHTKDKTPWGEGKYYSQETIDTVNARWNK